MRARRVLVTIVLVTACSDFLKPVGGGTFAGVSSGNQHTCGLLSSGLAYCWGRNVDFQLGTGSANARDSFPQRVVTTLAFTQIDANQFHSCAVTAAGAAYCWGTGSDGELGSDTTTTALVPVPVDGGHLFRAVTLGMRHTCALTTAGAAYCWGDNSLDQLGRDTAAPSVTRPVLVAGGHTFTAISAGDFHTCGIASGGAAYCWGYNIFGALGTGDSANAPEPALVAGNHQFFTIAGGNVHTCAITTIGNTYCWGAGVFAQLGNGAQDTQLSPVQVSGSRTFRSVSVGANHSCALDTNDHAFCWGSSFAGQLGATPPEWCRFGAGAGDTVPCAKTPIAAATGYSFRSLSSGAGHVCGIERSGGAVCWGGNPQGQLGNGVVGTNTATPVRVPDPQ